MPINLEEGEVLEEQFVREEQIPEMIITIPEKLLETHQKKHKELDEIRNNKLKNHNPRLGAFLDDYGRDSLKVYDRNFFVERIGNKEISNGKKSKNIGAFFDQNGALNPDWKKDLPEYIEVTVKKFTRLFSTKDEVTGEIIVKDKTLKDLNELQKAEEKIENENYYDHEKELQNLLYKFFEESYQKNSRHGRVVFVEALNLYLTELIKKNADMGMVLETLIAFTNKVNQDDIKADNLFQEIIEKILNKYEKTLTNNEAQVLLHFVAKFVKDSPMQDEDGNVINTKQNLVNNILEKCHLSFDDVLYFIDDRTISSKEYANYLIANNSKQQIEKIIISILDRNEDDGNLYKNVSLLLGDLIGNDYELASKILYDNLNKIKSSGLEKYSAVLFKKLLLNKNLTKNQMILVRELIPEIGANEELKNELKREIKNIIGQSNTWNSTYKLLTASVYNGLIDKNDNYILEQSDNIIKNLVEDQSLSTEIKVEILIELRKISPEINNINTIEAVDKIISKLPLEPKTLESKVRILINLKKQGLLDSKNENKKIIKEIIQNDITKYDGEKEIQNPSIFLGRLIDLSKENIFLAKDYDNALRKDILECLIKNKDVHVGDFSKFFNLFPNKEYQIDLLKTIKPISNNNSKVKLVMSFLNHLYRNTNTAETNQEIIDLLQEKEIQELFLNHEMAENLINFIDNFSGKLQPDENDNEIGLSLASSQAKRFGRATKNINNIDKVDSSVVVERLKDFPKIIRLREELVETTKNRPNNIATSAKGFKLHHKGNKKGLI